MSPAEPQPAKTAAAPTLDRWAGHATEELRARWAVPALVALDTTASTNDVARGLADAGAAHGTTVVADHQILGRGRQGRRWADRPGASLLLSMVLRPRSAPAGRESAGSAALPLLVGLACVRAIHHACGADVSLEWPNDLVVRDLKLGGILCEAARRAGRLDFVVAGIGINLDGLPDDLPDDARTSTTSLAAVAPRSPERSTLAGEVVRRVAALRADDPISDADLADLRRIDALAGRRVRLATGREGVAAGILADGALLVDDDGERFLVRGGSVSPVRPPQT